jgi:hypothetical protein
MGAGRQRFEPANQQVVRSIPATNVANQECVEGEAILSARPFKKRQLGVLPMSLEDLLPKSSAHTPTSTAISLKSDDVWLLRLLRFLRVFCNLGI